MIIYKATNKINDKCYIGKTVRTLVERKAGHESYAKNMLSNSVFHKAIRKYGSEKFEWEVIESCKTEDDLNLAEEWYIKKFKSYVNDGYNLTYGGEGSIGRITSNETKLKIGLGNKGKEAWNKGLTKGIDIRVLDYSKKLEVSRSIKMKENMSKARKRWIKNNPDKAFKHLEFLITDEAKEKRKNTIKKNKSYQGKNNPRYIEIDKKAFLELYNQGVKLSEIAILFNIGLGTIRRRVNKYNLPKRKRSMII